MLQFIVLGLVPGTNIQLNFVDVLRLVATLSLLYLLLSKVRSFKLNPKMTLKLFPTKLHDRKA